jgi:hypothetical protein
MVGWVVTASDRLLSALDRLAEDLSAVVFAHHDVHCCDDPAHQVPTTAAHILTPDDPVDGLVDGLGTLTADVGEVFNIATNSACTPAATATKGQVCVPVPMGPNAVPLAGCLAVAVVPGRLPGPPSAPVSVPPMVPPQTDHVDVSISTTLDRGLYCGHLVDKSQTVVRPFLIYLDGLP